MALEARIITVILKVHKIRVLFTEKLVKKLGWLIKPHKSIPNRYLMAFAILDCGKLNTTRFIDNVKCVVLAPSRRFELRTIGDQATVHPVFRGYAPSSFRGVIRETRQIYASAVSSPLSFF